MCEIRPEVLAVTAYHLSVVCVLVHVCVCVCVLMYLCQAPMRWCLLALNLKLLFSCAREQ